MSYLLQVFPRASVCPTFTVKVNKKEIVTEYAANALATNGAAGYGKVEYTVYGPDGNIATDAGGQLLNRIPARCLADGSGTFYLTIYNGLLTPGDYTVQ